MGIIGIDRKGFELTTTNTADVVKEGTTPPVEVLNNTTDASCTIWAVIDYGEISSDGSPSGIERALRDKINQWLNSQNAFALDSVFFTTTRLTIAADDGRTYLVQYDINYATPIRTNIWKINFSSNTESIHIIQPKERKWAKAIATGTVPEGQNVGDETCLIGLQDGAPAGIDIIGAVGQYQMSTTLIITKDNVESLNEIGMNIVMNAGKTNSESFMGFDPNTLLFVGGSGISVENSKATVTLNFDFRPKEEITFAGETYEKDGHEVVSTITYSAKSVNATNPVDGSTPLETGGVYSVFADRVYDGFDFNGIKDDIENFYDENGTG